MSCTCSHLQVVGGSLLPEAVTWFFTSVLRGLQFHGQHETCNATLSYLAMLIYDNLVSLVPIITPLDYSLDLYTCHYFCSRKCSRKESQLGFRTPVSIFDSDLALWS